MKALPSKQGRPVQEHRRAPLLVFVAFVIAAFTATAVWHYHRLTSVPERNLADIRASGKLRVLITYDPINYFIYRGAPMGYSYELAREFARHLKLALDVVVVKDMNRQCSMLRHNNGDLIAHFITITPAREKLADFTTPLDSASQVLIQRKPGASDTTRLVRSQNQLAGKTIHVRQKSAYYATLQSIMRKRGITFRIVPVQGSLTTSELIAEVSKGEINYTVADDNIASTHKALFPNIDAGTRLTAPLPLAWAVRKNSPELLGELNRWLEKERKNGMLAILHDKYYNHLYQFKKRALYAFYSSKAGTISRFDHLVKRQARQIDWDWRLLSALIYEESRFDPNAISWAGASGLMQLMPETGAEFGASNLFDPAQNIRAGARFLQSLEREWDDIPEPESRIKFILASYNVGAGHVRDAQRLAVKYGAKPDVWEGNVEKYLELKSEPQYYNDPVTTLGYCNGQMATWYTRHVIQRYHLYKQVIPK